MSVAAAIEFADALLPGVPSPEGEHDPRWAAIIEVEDFIPDDPEPVWQFALRWGAHEQEDLKIAIATCLLEDLMEYHFDTFFPRIEKECLESPEFAKTFMHCWHYPLERVSGEAVARFKALESQIEQMQSNQPVERTRHGARKARAGRAAHRRRYTQSQ
jgi:hypothetical protein